MSRRKVRQEDLRGIELCTETVEEIFLLAFRLTGNQDAAKEIIFRAALQIKDYNTINDIEERYSERRKAFMLILSMATDDYNTI